MGNLSRVLSALSGLCLLVPSLYGQYHDYRTVSDIHMGIPTKVEGVDPSGPYSDEYSDGAWVKHNNTAVGPHNLKRDANGRLIRAQLGPQTITYESDSRGFLSRLTAGDEGSRQTYSYGLITESITGNTSWAYKYTGFNSHGDWTACQMTATANNGKTYSYKRSRDIRYADNRRDNSLTVLDPAKAPLPGCVLHVCDRNGNELPHVQGYVSDIDGKIYNLPFFEEMTYKLSFYGYRDSVVDANPNAVVIMEE